ncbi:DUF551 domain-containing protein [Yersinia alsatica]|uniref:DUF551 domain-containing protein n=1 Tax=Yersinia alsatica TaxID=2890317 RepID=UPI0011A4D1F2|nr:DUF551 domain-containing protein [Yersinia alsatica]
MKELDKFTVERLEEFIRQPLENGFTRGEQMALARIALAAKRAEPVGYVASEALGYKNFDNVIMVENASGRRNIPLYTIPPANSPVVPEGWIKCSNHKPERGTDFQVYCSDTREQFVAFHLGNGEFQYAQHEDTSITCRPSHWMPLPASPEKP